MPDFRPSFLQGLALGSAFRLALPREAMRGLGGARAGAAAGSSLDFLDFREYHPGDDLRRLDWSVYARTDREVVKLYREEVFPRLDIVLDASRSMDLPGTAKASSALALCGALAAAAANAGCAAALWTAGESVRRVEGASGAEPAAWPLPALDSPAPPSEGFAREHPAFPRAGIRAFVSDLLFPDDPATVLRPLSDGAAAVWVLQVLAPDEADPAPLGPRRLVDVETGAALDAVLDQSALASYRAALAAHRARWEDAARRHGATLVRCDAPERSGRKSQAADQDHSAFSIQHSALDISPLLRSAVLEPL